MSHQDLYSGAERLRKRNEEDQEQRRAQQLQEHGSSYYTEQIITVGKRNFTEHYLHVTYHFITWSVKMAGYFSKRSRSLASSSKSLASSSSSSSGSKIARRQVTVATFEKWQRQFDSDHQSLLWLRYMKDRSDSSLVSTLWCDVC